MLTVLDLAQEDTSPRKKSIREMCGPCPDPNCRCQTNGFNIKFNGEKWVFMCRGCWDSEEYLSDRNRKRGWGDEADYLMHYRHMPLDDVLLRLLNDGTFSFEDAYKTYAAHKRVPYEQAMAYLEGLGANREQRRVQASREQLAAYKRVSWQDKRWQRVTGEAVAAHAQHLWTPDDTTALDYVRKRGFTDDEMLHKAKIGYSVHKGVSYLIIPNYSDELRMYTTIYRRDLRSDVPHEERWKDAPGGTKSELYLSASLNRKLPTILTEAPLDALSVVQECSDIVNVVATGGAGCGHNTKNLARLALMPLILVAFDADAPGDDEAKWWLERLPNARRLRPLLHDINDMLVQGWDIRGWIQAFLAEREETQAASAIEADEVEVLLPDQCADCHTSIESDDRSFFYIQVGEDQAVCYCSLCRDEQGRPLQSPQSSLSSRPTIQERAREIAQELREQEETRYRQAMSRHRKKWVQDTREVVSA